MKASSPPYILICSSDSRYVDFLRRSLSGYALAVVDSTTGALDAVQHLRPQLVLADMFLPDADVFDFLIQLQNMPERRPRIAVLTNQGSETLAEQLRSLHVGRVLPKQEDAEILWQALEPLLGTPAERADRARPVAGEGGGAAGSVRHGSVLVVEDSTESAQAATMLLGLLGLDATIAQSAERALELLPKSPYNLLMLDLRLPGMDGVELLARIRHSGCRIPCIVITGSQDQEDRNLLSDLGVEAVFDKPANYEDVSEAILSLVSAP